MANRFERYQIEILKMAFEESEHLTRERKLHLARITGLDMEQVSNWFNRKRARKRAKESMRELQRINSQLRESLQELLELENNLKQELQESRERQAALEDENQLLKRRESENPTKEKKIELMMLTNLDIEQISSWFARKRKQKRESESSSELERMKQSLKESKRREAELENENRHLKRRLTFFEGDPDFESVNSFVDGSDFV